MKLILASQSPRRASILQEHGYEFTIQPADIDETPFENENPRDHVKRLAKEKALKVAEDHLHQEILVLAADTIVLRDQDILGKPVDENHARDMLQSLSGRAHDVVTGFAVHDCATGKTHVDCAVTKVWLKDLTEKQIADYITTGEPLDKAGAYGIQTVENEFVEKIEGSRFNVIGLPIEVIQASLPM